MPIRWTVNDTVTAVNLVPATRVADATPVTGTDFDVRAYPRGSRFLLVLDAFETNVANTGGTWTVTESETDGGSYTAATTDGSLAATGATPGNVQRVVSVLGNPAKPFVHPVFTGADANAEVDVTAILLVIPAALV
jgi:hypothetical protein